ncbi:MAG: tetratricopeptide repeat protein [Planctomycetota bacterium]
MNEAEKSERRLADRRVCFTGRLANMSRPEAKDWVERCGGAVTDHVGPKLDLLVVGDEGWPLKDDGHLTRKLERAIELKESGAKTRILTEQEFLEETGFEGGSMPRLYTAAQLARILSVSRDRLRRWVRSGLVQPAVVRNRRELFDFRQVASAKALADLVTAGVPAERVRKSLAQLGRWHEAAGSLSQLALLESGGQLLIRLESGHLAEPSGQLQLGFEEDESGSATIAVRSDDVDSLFERALNLEDHDRLEEAKEAYRRVIEVDPSHVEAMFNLGNVLYGLHQLDTAIDQYRRAIEQDERYVEAWNNLGIALGDQERWREALNAFQRALAVEPTYADAHYNLAETYEQLGLRAEADRHWRDYLRYDPTSTWAREVREKLGG